MGNWFGVLLDATLVQCGHCTKDGAWLVDFYDCLRSALFTEAEQKVRCFETEKPEFIVLK